jgi:hypothetical protein
MMKFRAQFYISLAILISFGGGYFLARGFQARSRYLTAMEFLHRLRTFPVGKLKEAGTYYIQLPDGQGLMNLAIDVEPRSGIVKDISLSGRDVLFWYKALSRYGMPVALLSTGGGKVARTWVDVGLKGRFVEKSGFGGFYRRIQGKWVSLFGRMHPIPGTNAIEFYYKGSLYGFDGTTDDWEPVKAHKH